MTFMDMVGTPDGHDVLISGFGLYELDLETLVFRMLARFEGK
jgi:hypothetical protein